MSFRFYDVGGFTDDTLSAHVWLEGRDDGSNGGDSDGVPQRLEYQDWPFYTHQNGNFWTVNVTVNDTVNDDHEWGYVLLEGTDVAGFGVPVVAAGGRTRSMGIPNPPKVNSFHLNRRSTCSIRR